MRGSLIANLYGRDFKRFSVIPIIQENMLSFIFSAVQKIPGTSKLYVERTS
jgi:hypothetical protein